MTTNGDNRENNTQANLKKRHAGGIRDHLKAYTDRELSLWQRWRVHRHVSVCEACRAEIIALSRVSEEISILPQPAPRPELRTRILANLPTTSPVPARPRFLLRPPVPQTRFALASAICALLLLSLYATAYRLTVQRPVGRALVSSLQVVATNGNYTIHNSSGNAIAATTDRSAQLLQPTSVQNEAQPNYQQSFCCQTPETTSTPEVLTDPTSREADHILFEERQSELAAAIRHARKLSAQLDALANAHRERPTDGYAPEHTMQLAVVDVAAARERLSGLVQELGGTTVSANTVITSAESGAGRGNRHVPGTNASAPTDSTVSFAVPGNQVSRFQDALRQLGTMPAANGATRSETAGPANGSATPPSPLPKTHQRLVPRVAEVDPSRNSGTDRTTASNPRALPDGGIANYRVFTIKLQPVPPPAR